MEDKSTHLLNELFAMAWHMASLERCNALRAWGHTVGYEFDTLPVRGMSIGLYCEALSRLGYSLSTLWAIRQKQLGQQANAEPEWGFLLE